MLSHLHSLAERRAARQAAATVLDDTAPADEAPVETYAELQARAKAAGLSAGGSRAELEARLAAHEAG